jgi:type I restriction enzyme S subunit
MAIPEDWKFCELERIVAKKVVYGIIQAGPNVDKGVPYIRSTDVGREIDVNSLLHTTIEIAKKYKKSEVVPGDIVFSLRGNIGATSIVPEELSAANLTQGTARISVKENCWNHFIRYVLSDETVMKRIITVSKGSTFREITLEDLRKVKIPCPPKPEQVKIASVIGLWDRAIDLTEGLIAAKQERRKWLMQQLLTGKRRLPGFSNPCRTVLLGEVFTNRVESDYPDLPLVAITGENGVVNRGDLVRRDTSSEDKGSYLHICPGDIGYNTMRMWQGVCGLSQIEGIVSPAYTIVTPTDDIDGEFIALLFKSPAVVHLFHRHSQGLVKDTLNLKWRHFAEIEVSIPDIPEQQAITSIFRTADREIALLRQQLDALREQKKGLMQQLLTGKVRVKT